MRILFSIVFVMSYLSGHSQEKPSATQSFMVTGEVKQEVKISVNDFDKVSRCFS
jgi:hypothetical protein